MTTNSLSMDKDTWDNLANRIAKELWMAAYRKEHPGILPPEIDAAWSGDVVRTQRAQTKVALRKLEAKGVVFSATAE